MESFLDKLTDRGRDDIMGTLMMRQRGAAMIEKNIPIPDELMRNSRGKGFNKYPWRQCTAIGDSFVSYSPITTVEAAIKKFCYRNPEFSFCAMEVSPGEVRVWRVK